jgi:hypothetical protein
MWPFRSKVARSTEARLEPAEATTAGSTSKGWRTDRPPRAAGRTSAKAHDGDSPVTATNGAPTARVTSIHRGSGSASNRIHLVAPSAAPTSPDLATELDRLSRHLADTAKLLVDRGLEDLAHRVYLSAGRLAELAERAAVEEL